MLQSPAPSNAQQQGIPVPSGAPNTVTAVPQSTANSSNKPGWEIAVIVIAVLVGVFIAANAVFWTWWLVRALTSLLPCTLLMP
jgi:hypothetical protein